MKEKACTCTTLIGVGGTDIYFTGPPKEAGPLPALFYFALTGTESLTLHPFNQPVQCMASETLRVFSLTLPGHGPDLDPTAAMGYWARHMEEGDDVIGQFLDDAKQQLNFLIDEEYIDPAKVGVAGVSRGAFIATHVAAKIRKIKVILGFSPITRLSTLKEFSSPAAATLASHYDLANVVESLSNKILRYYIGNYDRRVDTRSCFDTVTAVVDAAIAQQIHSPKIELILFPSIGHRGHGTSPEVFVDGARWIKNVLAQ